MYVRTYICTRMHVCMDGYMYVWIYVVCVCVHMYMYALTCLLACMHTCLCGHGWGEESWNSEHGHGRCERWY